MSTPYLITFTPVNRFFFGSSQSFAESFYAESMKYPQPTTILGCLRDTILLQNNVVKESNGRYIADINNGRAKELTGTSKVNGLNDSDDFGVIGKVSPIFIVKQGDTGIEDILFPVPNDIEIKDCNLNLITYEKKSAAISSYSGKRKDYAIRSSKDPKLYSKGYLGGKRFWNAYINNKQPFPYNSEYDEEEIFKANTSVGIGYTNKDAGKGNLYFKKTIEPGMFYTKIDYSFKEGYSFGVIVWLTESSKLKNGIIRMGGEQSTFCMEVHPIADGIFLSHPVTNAIINNNCDFFENLKTINSNEKLIALSSVVFDKAINKSLLDIMEHRIVQGIQSTRMLTPGKRVSGKGEKSESVCMIPAGSAFYPEKSANITMNWKIPFKIGYNTVLDYLNAIETFCKVTKPDELKKFDDLKKFFDKDLDFSGKEFIVFNDDTGLEIEDYSSYKNIPINQGVKDLIKTHIGIDSNNLQEAGNRGWAS